MSGLQQLGSSIASIFRPVDTRAAEADQAKIMLDRRQREATLGKSLADRRIKESQADALNPENLLLAFEQLGVPANQRAALLQLTLGGLGTQFKATGEGIGQLDENARRNRIEANFDPNNPRGIEGARAALGLALTPRTSIEGGVMYDSLGVPGQDTYRTAADLAGNEGTWSDYSVTNKDGTTTPYLLNNKTREVALATVGRPPPPARPPVNPAFETQAQREARVTAAANQMVAAGKPEADIQQFINNELGASTGETTDGVNVSLGGSLAPPPRMIDGVSVPAPGSTGTAAPGLGTSIVAPNPLMSYPKPGAGVRRTEDQGKSAGWLASSRNAYNNILEVSKEDPDALVAGVYEQYGPVDELKNRSMSPSRQRIRQAFNTMKMDFLHAATGAGFTVPEAELEYVTLAPQRGDSDAVITQKMKQVLVKINALAVRANEMSAESSAPADGYEVGDIIQINGKNHRVTGGDMNDPYVEEVR